MDIALVNTNRMKPPIAPIGLDYLAEALNAAEHYVEVLDLCWEEDCDSAIESFFNKKEFDLVGITLRNTDDCAYTSRQSFIDDFAGIVDKIRKNTDGLLIIGGVGFSVMPDRILRFCEADIGIWGDGEFVFLDLIKRLEGKWEWHDLPNLIYKRDNRYYRTPASLPLLKKLPPMSRDWIDNLRYFQEGGQAGIETKRGCPCSCIYCADPVAKGNKVRTRPPEAVVDEMERLLNKGIDHIHTCDSEFNLPNNHAAKICKEIIKRRLGDRLRWYSYCSPVPFSKGLAGLMKQAGCVGINFGVDSGDEMMLKRLCRDFTPEDILRTVHFCKDAGLSVMLDLLIGAPGETKESIINTIEFTMRSRADRIGIAAGVRVYPGTQLSSIMAQAELKDGCAGGHDPLEPLFFLEPEVAPFVFDLLDDYIGDDQRFLFFDPSRPDRNYNYNANELLTEAIKKGYRGAYWDILFRL
ncbi:MAG: B12-binding domain-containing radical SAM protein [bacterium]